MNTLSEEDAKLFYQLWLPLLEYVNKKTRAVPSLKHIDTAKRLNTTDVKKVAERLWDDVSLIDRYLQANPEIPEEHREILLGWKRRIRGRFTMERHLKDGSIFIGPESEETVYLVSGIITSWEEMFDWRPMPVFMNAVLIPFRDVIISDGLNVSYSIMIGTNMKKELKDIYILRRTGKGKTESP